jgi:hypothetical protein
LFKQTAAMFPVHLALGNFMVTCNPEAEPRSGATACRYLRQSEYLLHEFDTSFRNDGYNRLLARQDATFLMHPSQFVAIGPELAALCGPAITSAQSSGGEIVTESIGEGKAIRIASNPGVEAFSKIFAPHYGIVDRPTKFWKEAEWRHWLARVQSPQPRSLFDAGSAGRLAAIPGVREHIDDADTP